MEVILKMTVTMILMGTWTSLASQPYFSSCACALGRGAGEGKEKYVW